MPRTSARLSPCDLAGNALSNRRREDPLFDFGEALKKRGEELHGRNESIH